MNEVSVSGWGGGGTEGPGEPGGIGESLVSGRRRGCEALDLRGEDESKRLDASMWCLLVAPRPITDVAGCNKKITHYN